MSKTIVRRGPRRKTSPELLKWINGAVDQSGLSDTEIAVQLKGMGFSMDKSIVGKLLNDKRGMTADELFALIKITKAQSP
jgi:hypothetical protein